MWGGGRGYLRGPEVGGAIIGWALGSFWWVGRGGFVSLNGLAWDHLSVHHSLGGWVILGYLWASMVSIKLSHNLGDHSTYNI